MSARFIFNKREWNESRNIAIYLADFVLQEQAEDNLILAFS